MFRKGCRLANDRAESSRSFNRPRPAGESAGASLGRGESASGLASVCSCLERNRDRSRARSISRDFCKRCRFPSLQRRTWRAGCRTTASVMACLGRNRHGCLAGPAPCAKDSSGERFFAERLACLQWGVAFPLVAWLSVDGNWFIRLGCGRASGGGGAGRGRAATDGAGRAELV